MEGREVFPWQNKVSPTHQGGVAGLWCKVQWPHRHKPPSREKNSVLAGKRITQLKPCAVFYGFKCTILKEIFNHNFASERTWNIRGGQEAQVCWYIHWSSSTAWGLMPRPENVVGSAHFAVTQEEFSAFLLRI